VEENSAHDTAKMKHRKTRWVLFVMVVEINLKPGLQESETERGNFAQYNVLGEKKRQVIPVNNVGSNLKPILP